jgi:dTDP-4-dehydrorhamnose reductase
VRVWLSGGSGFVGSHLVRAFDDVLAPRHAEVDVTDPDAVRRSVDGYAPDAIVHAAILNDFARLEREGWAAYVGATRNLVATGVPVVLISTDWVFDGTRGGWAEADTPNPVNRYGMLKAACELLDFGPPPPSEFPIPYDTSLDARATASALGVALPDVDAQLRRLERSLTCLN